MAEDQHRDVPGWQIVLGIIVLLVLAGYLYLQAKKAQQTGVKQNPYEFFGIPSTSPYRMTTSSVTPTPRRVY